MSIAVPVYNSAGVIVGSINVGAPSVRMTPEIMVDVILPKLQETVANISRAIKR
jgi:IclR family pca regulon transcriptional regulator